MKSSMFKSAVVALAVAIMSLPAQATSLQRLGIADMTDRADKIFRGIVIDVEQTSMQLGGGEIPVVRYRLQVEEQLKGAADIVKGDDAYIEIKMVGSIKEAETNGSVVKFSAFRDVPKLQMGSDYVLFTSAPSSVGLSAPIGLGQGAFDIMPINKQDMVMNQYGNSNIDGADGEPMSYASLKQAITAAMAQ